MSHPRARPLRVTLRFLEKILLGGVLGAYLVISRTIASIAGLYLVLYFLVGTSTFMDVVRQLIADNIPGVISAASVRWGPAPWELRIADGRVFGEHGEEVVQVDAIIAEIDVLPTLAGLFRFVTEAEAPFAAHFNHVRLGRPKAFIRVDEAGRVDIERAFVRDEDPVAPGPPLTFDITAKAVDVIDAGGTVDAPGYHLAAAGLYAVSDFSLTGRDHVTFFVPRAHAARADNELTARARFDERLGPIRIPVTNLAVEGFQWNDLTFTWRHARGDIPGGHLSGGGGWDVGPELARWHGSAAVHLARDAPATAAFVGDAFSGELDLTLDGAGDTEQASARAVIRSTALELDGVPLTDLRLGVRALPRGVPSDPMAHALAVDWLVVNGLGGRIAMHNGHWGPDSDDDTPDRVRDFAAAIRLDGVRADAVGAALLRLLPPEAADLEAPLSVPIAEAASWITGGWDATLHGNIIVAGAHAAGAGETDASVLIDDVSVAWHGTGLPLAGDYTVGGTARWHSAPPATRAGAAHLAPERRLALERIAIDGRGDRLRLEGSVDFTTGALDITPYLRLGDVGDDARHLGLGDLGGRFVLKSAHLGGTLDAPRVRAVASWSDARAAGHALGHVTARLALAGDRLQMTGARGASALGTVSFDGHLTLFDGGFGHLDRALPFQIDRLDATGLDVGLLLPELGVRAPVDIARARLSGELAHLGETLVGQGTLTASSVELGGEPLRELSARVDANAQRIALEDVTIVGRGGERVTGNLRLVRSGQRLHGSIRAKDVPLAAIRAVRRAAPDLRGTVGANLTVGGTLAHPSLIGRIALGGISWDGVDLGDAELDLQTLPSGRVDISSASFFRGFELIDGSGAELDGFVPTHVHLAIRGADARLSDLFPALRRRGFQLTTRASATLDLWPRRAGKPWDLRVDAAAGEVALDLRDQNIRWTNATPLALVLERQRTRIAPVAFVSQGRAGAPTTGASAAGAASEALSVCGTLDQDGALDLELAGVADLGILRALKDVFSVFEGRVAIAAAPTVAASLGDDRCLPGSDDAVLRVTGSLAAPVFAGRLEPVGVTLVPRDFGREVRLVDHRGVDLAPGPTPGSQRVVSSVEDGLVAEVDDGNLALAGELALSALELERAEVAIVGTDVFYSSPGEFTATFNPSLRFRASDLRGDAPRLALSGQVLITDGHFTRSFDTFAHAIGSAIGGARSKYSRPVGEAAPWLAGMTLDIDLKSSDFHIDSAFPLGHANMEARLDLTIGGTLDVPKVYRRIDLLPGGNLTYRVFRRDFEIRSGYVDFDGDAEHPTLDVTAQTEVTYLARASSDTQDEDEKEVLIALRIHGRVPDLKIEMSSDDSSFDQDDLQSLILTGRPRRELDRSSGSSVVTADLAAIFNEILKSPFVRTAAVGLSREGDLRADVGTCFGPDLCFSTTAVQETTETTLRARFRLHLGDDLTCDGTLRRSDTGATTSTEETYEARCRYRIPLD